MRKENEFLSKRILSFLLCFTLIFGTFIPNYVKAKEKITINVKTKPKIDIMLTPNETHLDLTNFEEDLIVELNKNNIPLEEVNIQAINRETIDTNTTNASQIFNSWTQFPFNKSSSWYYDNNIGAIRNNVNPAYETGFMDTSHGYIKDVILNSRIYGPQSSQPLGYIFRVHKQENNPNRYNMYMLWVSANTNNGNRIIGLFKIEGLILDYNIWKNYAYSGTYTAMALAQWTSGGKTYWGWIPDGSNWYNFGGYPYTTPTTIGTVATNIKDAALKTTTLGWINVGSAPATFDLKLSTKGDEFVVNYNNNDILTIHDASYKEGYYGFFQTSHVDPRFYGMTASFTKYKTYKEIINEPKWRENAHHFVINVGNEIDNSFIDSKTKGEILTKTINDNINFIQWGSSTNQEVMKNFISENNNNGIFLDGTNYENVLKQTAEYIASFYEKTNKENQHIVIDTLTNLEVNPIELITNTKDKEYPNGKWIIHHNAKYFANSIGQSEYSEQYMDNLNTNFIFDKSGEYDVYYGEDLVKTIYAHRKPIANFSMSLNSDKTLNLVNQSYDLDSNENKYGFGNGIKEIQWQWKNMNDDNWTLGQPTSALVDGESYVFQLVVKDEQDVSSLCTSKYITLDKTIEISPIAAFSFGNSTIFTNNELEIIDNSYDPNLESNSLSYEWTLKKGQTTISTSATPTLKFDSANLGAGDYSYTLVVTNSKGLKSEAYTKSFKVIDDTIAPSVMIEPTYSEWGDSSAINFEFMDSGSGFARFRYTHSATQTPPSDTDTSWSEWSTNDNGSLTINEDGVWYLHLQAYDNNNNLLTRTVGVYRIDTTNPIIDSVTIDDSSIEREIPITVVGHDDTSGIKYYRFVNESTNEDSGYIETNVYNAKSNGVYTIYVKDKNNNEVSTLSEEITIVDRVAPNVVTLKVDTNTSEWTTNLETTIKAEDTFSGMNTYSYSLEKVDNKALLVNNEDVNNPLLLKVYAEQNVTYNPLTIDMDTFDVNAYQWQENDTFNVNENGTYNLYARDNANNVSGVQFTIGNIDTTAPTIESITKSNENVTNEDIVITIVGANDDQAGLHEKPYSYDNGNTWTSNNTYVVTNNTNGEVNVLVRDAIENIATFTYSIDNIDKTLPSFEDLNISNNREEKKSTITFSFSDDREFYGYVLKTNSSLPQDSEYITNFEIDNGIVTSEYEVSKNGIYYLFIKDKAGNIYPQKLQIDALVTGIDFSQDKVTEYQTIGEESNISLYNTRNQITNEGDFDTYVYVSQQSTFSVVIPKIIILDGQTGYADYQASVLGNIAGKETIGVIPNDSFEMKDSDGVKANIVATVSQGQTSFAYDEIINKTTTNGSISAPSISAGRWNGILNFNVLVQNNLNIKDSIASVSEDSFALQVDDNTIVLK